MATNDDKFSSGAQTPEIRLKPVRILHPSVRIIEDSTLLARC
jgi:hypothetical protein